MKNGLAHILAISGMHIAIIAGAVERLLMLLGMGRKKRGIAVILMVLLYGVMTGLAASTIRAIVMLSMKHIGVLIGRTSDVPTDMMTATTTMTTGMTIPETGGPGTGMTGTTAPETVTTAMMTGRTATGTPETGTTTGGTATTTAAGAGMTTMTDNVP